MIAILLALTGLAYAAPPADLDGLVALALERDPEAAALGYDADAARARSAGAYRLMDPQLMAGGEALGSKEEMEPPMWMIGGTQMFRGWGEAAARSDRLDLDAERALADRDRVEADLRARLWQASARIAALDEEIRLLDEQRQSAAALREVAISRYATGTSADGMPGAAMDGMSGGSMDGMGGMAEGVRPPLVTPRGGSAMPGMAGMGGAPSGGGSRGPSVPDFGSAAPIPTAGATGGDAGGLATLLRLDAELARVEADRAALEATRAGEIAVLARFVGEEAASAVASGPGSFYGGDRVGAPELRLAGIDREAAAADLALARSTRNPDVMLSVGERLMADGMPMGTDVSVGVAIPLWGGAGKEISAARAEAVAAESREDRVERDLAVAVDQAKAALAAAEARAGVLERVALPRAQAGWDATLGLFAAGQARLDEVVRAWETLLEVGRETVAARRDVQLRAAELARVEAP
jgi:outer membrane protein TolC